MAQECWLGPSSREPFQALSPSYNGTNPRFLYLGAEREQRKGGKAEIKTQEKKVTSFHLCFLPVALY